MKTIIEMAREAGLPEAWISETGVLKWSDLERFAALVRADERDRVKEALAQPVQEQETKDLRTPEERRDAGQRHCPVCFTFGQVHRRGCVTAYKEKNT